MKNFIAPEIDVVKFSAEDVITTSGATQQGITTAATADLTGEFIYITEDNAY